MAITKLARLKQAKAGTSSAHLKNNLFYICNPGKCAGGIYIGGNAGTTAQIIYETMMENKRFWNKEDGSQAFHYVISFAPEIKVSEEMAYEIAREFAKELLGDEYYYAFAVHNDQHHMHVHLTFDSVSKLDGHKFHSPKGDWENRIQPITDRICKKYGLPALEFSRDEKKGKNYGQWKNDQAHAGKKERGDVTWYDLIRDDIDQAVLISSSFEEVLETLSQSGYEVKLGKYLSLRPPGRERPVRSSRLGDGYSVDAIRERVLFKKEEDRDFIRYGSREEIIAVLKLKKKKIGSLSMTPFQRAFYRRWHNCYLRNKPGRRKTREINADAVRVRKLSDAVKYMIDQNITGVDDLEKAWMATLEKEANLTGRKEYLRKRLYKASPIKDLSRYEKLLARSGAVADDEGKRELELLARKLDLNGGMEAVRKLREQTKAALEELKEEEKEFKQRKRLLEDIYTFYFEMSAPDLSQEKEHADDAKEKWKQQRVRITVHKKMIKEAAADGSHIVRIPGRRRLIRLPSEDTYLYKSGEILSAFLYDDETYEIFDLDGNRLQSENGAAVKISFDAQRDSARSKGR